MSDTVKMYEVTEAIVEQSRLPLDPHPPFALITPGAPYWCYPYQFYGSKEFHRTPRRVRLLVAENRYLKVAMAPDYGGRLWFMFDKLKQREVIHRVYTEACIYNAGMGYAYMGGGLELNVPNAHSYTNMRPRFCTARRNPDGSVSLVMNNIDKLWRLNWSVTFTLAPDEARLREDVRIANETPVEGRYMYWGNCGVPCDGDTEFIYPEAAGARHGNFENVVSWPRYAKRNIAQIRNVEESMGLYFLGAREGYFGCYNHREKQGILHYADVNDLPAKKSWTWGWHSSGQHTAPTHTDCNKCYLEVQSGRVEIQEEWDRLSPMGVACWHEFWFPYREIGMVNGVSEHGAVNFTIADATAGSSKAEVKLYANQPLRNTTLVVRCGDRILQEIPAAVISPEKPLCVALQLPVGKGDVRKIAVQVMSRDGKPVISALSKVEKPKEYDSYFIPEKVPVLRPEDCTAEGCFLKAEKLARDWFFHVPEVKDNLKKALAIDPAFSRAHAELGVLCLRVGELDQALEHFNKALARINDDGRVTYYKGLALWLQGNAKEASFWLRRSGRFGWESPERLLEAQIALTQGDIEKADEHLERAIAANSTVTIGYLLRAIVQTKMGDAKSAKALLAAAERIAPKSPFLACVRYLLERENQALKKALQARGAKFTEDLLEPVAILMSSGLTAEAAAILDLLARTNDIVELYRRHLAKTLSGKARAKSARHEHTVVDDFAWRQEELLMLRSELAADPKNAAAHWHLGNFQYAHGLEDEGITEWEKAYALGFRTPVSLYALFRAYRRKNDDAKMTKYLNEAFRMAPKDPYIFDDYVARLAAKQGRKAAVAFQEKNLEFVMKYPASLHTLLGGYIELRDYAKLENMLRKVNFPKYWQGSFGGHWVTLRSRLGFRKLVEGKWAEAFKEYEALDKVPASLAEHYYTDAPVLKTKQFFYLGLCQKNLGNEKAAREYWQKALTYDQDSRFELSYEYSLMQARFYQMYCLRALGRFDEATVFQRDIRHFAQNQWLSEGLRVFLLKLAALGEEQDINNFAKFDSEDGVAGSVKMATSVEE